MSGSAGSSTRERLTAEEGASEPQPRTPAVRAALLPQQDSSPSAPGDSAASASNGDPGSGSGGASSTPAAAPALT